MTSPSGAAAAQRTATLLSLGRTDEAVREATEGLIGDPGNSDLLRLLSTALLRCGRQKEALRAAERAAAETPDDPLVLSALAAARFSLKQRRAALAAVDRAIELAPHNADLHRQRSGTLFGVLRVNAGLAAARHARDLAPTNAAIAANLAHLLTAARRYDEAAEVVQQSLALDADQPLAHRVAGKLTLRSGGGRASMAHFRTALRADPSDIRSQVGLAEAVKLTNPAVRHVVGATAWLRRRSGGVRYAIVIPLLFLMNGLTNLRATPAVIVLQVVLIASVTLVWASDPVSNLVLLFDPSGRQVLSRSARLSAIGFVTLAVLALATFVQSGFGNRLLIPLAFAFASCAIATGLCNNLVTHRWLRVCVCLIAIAVASSIAAWVFLVVGWGPAGAIASAVGFTLGVALATTVYVMRAAV